MAYIGKTPVIGNFQVCDAISVVNGQAAYTMQVGGVNVSPESANHMLVSLNGILQAPTSSFTVSGSTITFASNLVTGDVIDFIQILGNVLDLGVPSDATVSTAKIVDANVTTAKIADTSVTPAKLNLNDNLLFNTASKGIYLGTTTAVAANLLDDYEEGTWTPVAAVSGFSTGISTLSGTYTKIGRSVTVSMSVNLATTGRPTSVSQFTGLPFAVVTIGTSFSANISIGSAAAGTGNVTVASASSLYWGTTNSASNALSWFTSLTYFI